MCRRKTKKNTFKGVKLYHSIPNIVSIQSILCQKTMSYAGC